MAFQTLTNEPEAVESAPKATRKTSPKKKKPVAQTMRIGGGPFGLAKGAKVSKIVTDWFEAVTLLDNEPIVALDLETGGLSFLHDHIFVIGLYGPISQVAAVIHTPDGLVPDGLIHWLNSNPDRLFVTHNGAMFDILFTERYNHKVHEVKWFDTLIGEQVITTTNRRGVQKNLQAVVKRRLGIDISKEVDHRDWYNETLSEEQVKYVAEDISFLPEIRTRQLEKAIEIEIEKGVNPVFGTSLTDAMNTEMELLPIVVKMQSRGLPIDAEALEEYYRSQTQEAASAGNRLAETFGEGINWGSHVQLKKAFKDKYDIQLISSTEDHLIEVRDLFTGHPAYDSINDILEYKHAAKRASMYNGSFLEKYTKDGWLHGNFSQCGTDTGRFSSKNPNLQQIPKNKGDSHGRGARHIIGNHPGLSIVSIDYSQIEFRVAANIAGDEKAFELFEQSHYDIHTMVAASVFGVEPSRVTKDQRQLSKAMSFTLLFGGGAYLLSKYAGQQGADLPLSKAQPIVIDFFDQFQGLARIRNQAYAIASRGYPYTIQLPTGLRRVLIPGQDLKATLILNNIVQGTAAAGLKYALLEAKKEGLDDYLGAVVHDETVSAVPNAYAQEFADKMSEAMLVGMRRVCDRAKVEVESTIGNTWG